MAAPIVPGQSNVLIDATAFTNAALAYGDKWDLYAANQVEAAMNQSGEIVQRAVRKRAKRHYRSGRLDKMITSTGLGAGWHRVVTVKSRGHVAHLVAGNVRAHMIRTRIPADRTMPLFVRGNIVGYAEAVEHPATRGDPYFHVGAMNSRLAINAVLKATAKRLVKHLADITEGKA